METNSEEFILKMKKRKQMKMHKKKRKEMKMPERKKMTYKRDDENGR